MKHREEHSNENFQRLRNNVGHFDSRNERHYHTFSALLIYTFVITITWTRRKAVIEKTLDNSCKSKNVKDLCQRTDFLPKCRTSF